MRLSVGAAGRVGIFNAAGRSRDRKQPNNRLADPDELADKMSKGRWIAKNPPEAYRDIIRV